MTRAASEAEAVGSGCPEAGVNAQGRAGARRERDTTGRLLLATVTERDGSPSEVQRRWRELIADFGHTAELRGLVVAQAAEWTKYDERSWPMIGPPTRAAREASGFGCTGQ